MEPDPLPIKPRRWWVVFRDAIGANERTWWHAFTSPGFRHCFAFCELTPGQVLLVDPTRRGVRIDLVGQRPDHLVRKCREAGFRVLVAKVSQDHHTPALIRRGLGVTCASFLAYLLGLDGRPLNPRQLWKLLKANGARDLTDERRRANVDLPNQSRELQSG